VHSQIVPAESKEASMAIILPLRQQPAKRTQQPPPTGGAEILIFTGVRYERIEGAQLRAAASSRHAPKRGRGKR
jgi:hypothetical protein